METAVRILPHYTYTDYKHWEGKWELIDGIPHAMSPAPLPKHQKICMSLGAVLYNAVKDMGCKKCTVSTPLDYLIAEDTIVQPDVLIYCSEVRTPYLEDTPVLVVEVSSPSTALKDRHTKYSLYEKSGVKYYLIIQPEPEKITLFLLDNGSYTIVKDEHAFQFQFQLDENCTIEVDFSEIW
ncbi:MAG: Uma2 family endonuclease [Bacteroidetes bacterium]|nr:MAG: Uma2 family endonuclease [Bacteroidota bacterium]